MRSNGSPAELEHRRYLAIRRLLEGYSIADVAEFLGVAARSVQRWWQGFLQNGWKGLAATAGAGRPLKLNSTQEKIVVRWLQEKPTDFGFNTELWTCRRLSSLIWQEWRIRLQPRYLPRWLRERGFTLQKPERVPRERDNEAIARWVATEWPRIKRKAAAQHAHLVVIDESGLLMAPLVKRTWALRGHRPVLFQKGKHREKVSLATALWLSPRRDQFGMIYRTLVNAYFNNERVAKFLEMLMQEIPNRMVVLWDRGNMHRGDPIRATVDRFGPRLSLEILPSYAPMLDPVEKVFSWLKYSQLSNYAPRDARELNHRIHEELNSVRHDQESLQNYWHASDLPLPKPLKRRH